MLSKRVIAVAPDRAMGKKIVAAAMAAGAAAESAASLDELGGRIGDAELFVYAAAAPDEPGLARLLSAVPPQARVVPILLQPDLNWITWLLANPNVPAIIVADPLDLARLTATLSKLLYGDLFGLEKVVAWGVKVHSLIVGDYQEKARAIGEVSEFAGAMGVRRKYREGIEQCLDELLMNALYDAPVDENGRPIFADVAVKDRVNMRVAEKAVVQYACDGDRFALSVRDAYGTLKKGTIIAFLEKCLHTAGAEQIDRKASGAGLGLYLIANAATELMFHIFPGTATEAVCLFDLAAPRIQLKALGVFEEKLVSGKPEVAGAMHTVRRRRREDLVAKPQPLPRALTIALTLSTALLLAAVALVALPYVKRPAPSVLAIDGEPKGAEVVVDGKGRGKMPVRVEGLEAGRSYLVRATAPGRRDEERVVVAQAGETPVRLELAAANGNLMIESDPAGAEVIVDGKPTGKVTPATIDLAPGQKAVVTLRKAGYEEQRAEMVAGAAGERAVYRSTMGIATNVASLTVEVGPEEANATVTLDGLALVPPGRVHEAFVKPRVAHALTVSAPGYVSHVEEIELGGGERKRVKVVLEPGGTFVLHCSMPAKVAIDGKAVGVTPLDGLGLKEGNHTVSLRGVRPLLWIDMTVAIERGKTVDRSFDLGTVVVTAPGVTVKPAGAKRGATEVAVVAGTTKVKLVGPGGEKEREVTVETGGKVVIDSW